jgi:hypothetical protein
MQPATQTKQPKPVSNLLPLSCRFHWHSWTKWTEIIKDLDRENNFVFLSQERHCIKCNEYQSRSVG